MAVHEYRYPLSGAKLSGIVEDIIRDLGRDDEKCGIGT
jgi:hypothetical protein